MSHPLTRQSLIGTLDAGTRGRPGIRATWLGGSDAFGRADEYSDIDLCLVADDGSVEDAFGLVERAIQSVWSISRRFRLPSPTWHGHEQAFYQIAEAPPTLVVDLVVFAASKPNPFRERQRHGTPVVLFDPEGLATPTELDPAVHAAKLRVRLGALRDGFPIFQPFIPKEIQRGRTIDAANFYHGLTIRPLVELLRIAHCPERFDFGLRYLDLDLPEEVYGALQPLLFPAGPDDLRLKHAAAVRLFEETSAAIGEP
jgi:predicted nucleotidyltransferase